MQFLISFRLLKQDCSTAKVLLKGTNRGGLYQFDNVGTEKNPESSSFALLSASIPIWHQRLGHPMFQTDNKIVSNNHLLVSSKSMSVCNSCHVSKSCKLPFPTSTTQYHEPLSLIVSDLWGPSPELSKDGFRYYILLMDVYSHYTWIYPLTKKSDGLPVFITFKQKIENLLQRKIKKFQSDNGGEYKKFTSYLEK